MSSVATASAQTDSIEAVAGIRPRGPKPKKLTVSRIGVYGFLIISAVFFLAPLWVMVVTSLKTMPEIRLGYLFNWPSDFSFEAWIKAWTTACTGRTYEASSQAS